MKKTIFFLISMYVVQICYSQDTQQFKEGNVVKFVTSTKHTLTDYYKKELKEPDVNNPTLDTVKHRPLWLETNVNFRIVDVTPDSYKITALPFDKLKERKIQKGRQDKSLYYNYKLFEVPKEEFRVKASIVEEVDRVSIGLLTLPFKFRIHENSFETEFNMNSTLNIKLWRTPFHLQFGAGIGGVDLNSSNSEGIGENEEIKASALSFLGGAMLQYKKVQAGLYCGWDFINNQRYYQWESNRQPWISFGIGYQLFDVNLLTQNKKNK